MYRRLGIAHGKSFCPWMRPLLLLGRGFWAVGLGVEAEECWNWFEHGRCFNLKIKNDWNCIASNCSQTKAQKWLFSTKISSHIPRSEPESSRVSTVRVL